MRGLTAALVLFLASSSVTALAQETDILAEAPEPPAIPPGEDVIVPLSLGATAPVRGMLLDTNTAIRWTNALRWWPEAFRLRVTYLEQVLDATRTTHSTLLEEMRSSYRAEITNLQLRILRAEEKAVRPWYRTAVFGFIVGVVLTAGAGVALISLRD